LTTAALKLAAELFEQALHNLDASDGLPAK
jgi:hypothetical protein